MSERRAPITQQTVVYRIPGMDAATVRTDVEYQASDAGPLTMDVYCPAGAKPGEKLPAVIIVAGFPDPGFEAALGCKFKHMGSSVSWARLAAAAGLMAVTYTNRDPSADLPALLGYLSEHGAELGIDGARIGLYASSGNVPVALSMLMNPPRENLKCAALSYGYMLDLDGCSGVAEAAGAWKFANPSAGKPVEDLSPEIPLFIARAGQDQLPRLNETLDRFLTKALALNLPMTFVNHPQGPHAFDLAHDSDLSREIIRQILFFLRFHLLGA
jgi:hypothetical protein